MTRELQIVAFCDICSEPAAHMETFKLGDAPAREVDLCEAHWAATTLAELAGVLADHGRVAIGRDPLVAAHTPATEGETRWCPECGKGGFKDRPSLASHLRNTHKLALAVLEGAAKLETCPDCGKSFAAPQGIATHRRKMHGKRPGDE